MMNVYAANENGNLNMTVVFEPHVMGMKNDGNALRLKMVYRFMIKKITVIEEEDSDKNKNSKGTSRKYVDTKLVFRPLPCCRQHVDS